MEEQKKFKNEKPEKKDHAGLKKAGKALKWLTRSVVAIVALGLNKDRLKNGLEIAKTFIKK